MLWPQRLHPHLIFSLFSFLHFTFYRYKTAPEFPDYTIPFHTSLSLPLPGDLFFFFFSIFYQPTSHLWRVRSGIIPSDAQSVNASGGGSFPTAINECIILPWYVLLTYLFLCYMPHSMFDLFMWSLGRSTVPKRKEALRYLLTLLKSAFS